MILGLVLLAVGVFMAWRTTRSVRTGKDRYLGVPADYHSSPQFYWFLVWWNMLTTAACFVVGAFLVFGK